MLKYEIFYDDAREMRHSGLSLVKIANKLKISPTTVQRIVADIPNPTPRHKVIGKTKMCSKCRRDLPRNSRYWHHCKQRYDGYDLRCKSCAKLYYATVKKTKRLVYIRNKTYGVEPETLRWMLLRRGNKCDICKNEFKDLKSNNKMQHKMCIDHDHETGLIRGLLCGRCNLTLGAIVDSVDILYAAISYLHLGKVRHQQNKDGTFLSRYVPRS